MILLGFKKLTVGGKKFTLSDAGVTYDPKQLGLDGFAGGSIKKFRKTKYGIYLCLSKRDDILFLGYTEDSLTDEGRKLLGMEPLSKPEPIPEPLPEPDKEPEPDITQLERKELIALAKKLEVEGKLATMKTVDLIAAIQEKRDEHAAQKGTD
jgi:hypothetical protein